jgi:hypothetical protein
MHTKFCLLNAKKIYNLGDVGTNRGTAMKWILSLQVHIKSYIDYILSVSY